MARYHKFSSSEDFKYSPLEDPEASIRVLTLNTSKENETNIDCLLEHKSLSTDYVCLSYTWGTDDPTHTLRVNGRYTLVRDNLHAFLKEAAHTQQIGATMTIWIDALCIDQDNIPEKNTQVAMMGRIYPQAHRVIAWLGEGNVLVENAWDLVSEHENFSHNAAVATPKAYWDAFDAIAVLPYWRRMWIVQELLLAQDVELWYGRQRIPLRWWSSFCNYINSGPTPDLSQPHLGNAKVIRCPAGFIVHNYFQFKKFFGGKGDIIEFQRAFHRFRGQICSNSRDYVYALRSLDSVMHSLPVDYDQETALLLPQLYSIGCTILQPEHWGLEVIERLSLGKHKCGS